MVSWRGHWHWRPKPQAMGEVPVGAVLVSGGAIAGEGWNRPIAAQDPSAHAEMEALRQAAGRLGNYRLPGSTLYVTLEPCAMCAGALVNARVARLVFGARDIRFGAVRSQFRLADSELLNHRVQVEEGLLAVAAAELLARFLVNGARTIEQTQLECGCMGKVEGRGGFTRLSGVPFPFWRACSLFVFFFRELAVAALREVLGLPHFFMSGQFLICKFEAK